MKVTTNKNESKKRKRDESQDAIAESPKKAKVHAQRKFAQGASYNSPSIPLIKDKVRPPVNVSNSDVVLPQKRPTTEDFLTFLCFRRTSLLPKRLDFFKHPYQGPFIPTDHAENTPNTSGCQRNYNFENTGKSTSKKSEKNEAQKKAQTPVQALRRKYHEQRLAKQNPANVTKLAQKVKGKNMIRTRSSTVQEEKAKPAKELAQLKDGKEALSGLRSGLQRAPPTTSKYFKKSTKVVEVKNLRSRVKEKAAGDKLSAVPFFEKKTQRSSPREISSKKSETPRSVKSPDTPAKARDAKLNIKKIEGLSDFSSDDNEPLLAVKKGKSTGKPKKLTNGVRDAQRSNYVKTRSQNSDSSASFLNTSIRPTRKTKEAAAIYMEMITKKLVSPEKSGDDDRSSVDSFPELPNAKRNEQRESEIKAKAMAMRRGSGRESNTVPKSENKKSGNISNKKKEIGKKILPGKMETTKKVVKENQPKKLTKQEPTKRTTREQPKKGVKAPVPKKQVKEDTVKKIAKNELSKKCLKEELKPKVIKEDKKHVRDEKKKPKEECAKKEEVPKKITRDESTKKVQEESKRIQKNKKEEDVSNKSVREENAKSSDDSSKKNNKEDSGKKSSKEDTVKKMAQDVFLDDTAKNPLKEDTGRRKEEPGRKTQHDDVAKRIAKDELPKKNLRDEAAKKGALEELSKKISEEESCKRNLKESGLDEPQKKIMKGESTKKVEGVPKKTVKEDIVKTGEDSTKDEPATVKKGACDDVTKKALKDNVKRILKEESPKKNLDEEPPKKICKDELSRKGVKEEMEMRSDDEGLSGKSSEISKSDTKKEKLMENVSNEETSRKFLQDDPGVKPSTANENQTKEIQKNTEGDHEIKEKRDKLEKEPCHKVDGECTKGGSHNEIKEVIVKNTPDGPRKRTSDSEENLDVQREKSVETKEVDVPQKRNTKNLCKETEDDSMDIKSEEIEPRPSTRGRRPEESENKPKKVPERLSGPKKPNAFPKKGSAAGSSVPNTNWLPASGSASNLVEAPTFYPTEKEFQDPLEFFERIRPAAESFGLCRIVPPSTFKPDCKVSDDMRFTAYNQYVHRMFHRWGPNIKQMMAIKKYLATQSISLKQPPWIGGIEVDLPRLYQSVQNCGGLMKVMEKKKWNQVADMMRIPKAAQDRVTKLDDIYCKYLLPYDTLSQGERQKLFDEVERDWLKRQESTNDSGDEESEEEVYIDECEECIVKGRNMALNQFYRIARNTMSMWFKTQEPAPADVENEFWRHVSERNNHVCVHSGSIDSSGWGYGFPIAKNNTFSKHPWNLKVLTNNSGSVLRSLGPVMGVTVPTLHVGMVFTAFCWYRDPHGLPWVEYLHTGAPKIWYGISDDNSSVFKEALTKLLPRYIKNKKIWLPSDTAMVPPALLVDQGVSLCHTIQKPGQFILVFPRAFTSSICTGYLVSESVYFAQPSWLSTAEQVFRDIQDCCEPTMFSLEKLLFSIATDSRSSVEVLKQVLPMVWHIKQNEIDGRKTLLNLGLKSSERLPIRDQGGSKKKRGRWAQDGEGDYECEVCRTNLCVSLVINSQEETVLCLPHAIDLLTQKRHQLKYCKLMYSYTQEELCELVEKLEQRIESKSQKKVQNKTGSSSK